MEDKMVFSKEGRLAILTRIFHPGVECVFARHGERVLRGKIFRIEGEEAILIYRDRIGETEERAYLEKLAKMNPRLINTPI